MCFERIQCILFVKSSKDGTVVGAGSYAMLPPKFLSHPGCRIFASNDIQVITNAQLNLRTGVTYTLIEFYLDKLEPKPEVTGFPNSGVISLYVDSYNLSTVKQLFNDSKHKFYFSTYFYTTFLHLAINEEDFKSFKKVATSKNIKYGHPKGGALLHFAVKNDYATFIDFLLKCKAPINIEGKDKATPLHLCACYGRKNIARLLLSKGAKVNSKMSDGSTPLAIAFEKDDFEMIQLLVEKGADLEAKMKGVTPLFIAIEKERPLIVAHLLQHGANISATIDGISSMQGFNPLHFSIKKNRLAIVKLLFQNGAHVDAPCEKGRSPLFFAVDEGNPETINYVLTQTPSTTDECNRRAFKLAFKKDLEYNVYHHALPISGNPIIKSLLDYGFDVIPEDINEPDFLFDAIWQNQFEIVQKLVNNGANVNPCHTFQPVTLNPLHLAVVTRRTKIVELLLDHGANVNTKNLRGYTPLLDALERSYLEAVKLLLDHNANIKDHPNPLLFVVDCDCEVSISPITQRIVRRTENNRDQMVELLLEKGANLNVKSSEKQETLVYITLKKGYVSTFEVLMKFGADFSVQDISGESMENLNLPLKTVLDYYFRDLTPNDEAQIQRLFDSHRNFRDSAKILALHIVKIKVAFKSHGVWKLVPEFYRKLFNIDSYIEDFRAELVKLEDVTIGKTEISFYDVLIGSVEEVSRYARSEHFVDSMEYHDTKRRFPIYGSILDNKFRRGSARRKLIRDAIKMLRFLFRPFSKLPDALKESIVDLLTNQEIIILKRSLNYK